MGLFLSYGPLVFYGFLRVRDSLERTGFLLACDSLPCNGLLLQRDSLI